jgi:hypothetical protein
MMRATLVALATLYALDHITCDGRYTELAVRVFSAIERAFV